MCVGVQRMGVWQMCLAGVSVRGVCRYVQRVSVPNVVRAQWIFDMVRARHSRTLRPWQAALMHRHCSATELFEGRRCMATL